MLRRFTFLVLLFFGVVQTSLAQKNMVAGAIGYTNDSAGLYTIYLKYYYPCGTDQNADSLKIYAHSSLVAAPVDSFYIHKFESGDYNAYCPDSLSCNTSSKYRFKYNFYRKTINLDAGTYSTMNRIWFRYKVMVPMDAFYNPNNCSYPEFDYKAFLDRSLGENSSTGGLNNPPLFTGLLYDWLNYSFGGMDTVDRDSLTYAFQYLGGSAGPCYRSFKHYPPAGFIVDQLNGEMEFIPDSVEDKVAWEYIIRDMRNDTAGNRVLVGSTNTQVITHIIKDTTNRSPRINSPYSYSVCPGEELSFTLTTQDTSPSSSLQDTLTMQWNGGIPAGRFEITDSSARLKSGKFTWTPDDSHSSSNPYFFTVRVSDQHCPNPSIISKVYSIRVKPKAKPVISVDSLSCNRFAFSLSDSTGNSPRYRTEVLDINGNLSFDAYFVSSRTHVSIREKDTVQFKKNGTFILRVTGNNWANCPTIIYDTVRVDSAFNVRILAPDDIVCASIDTLFLNIDSFGHDKFQIIWNNANLDTLPYLSLHRYSTIPGLTTFDVRVKDERGCSIQVIDSFDLFGFHKLDTANFIHLSCDNDGHILRTTLDSASRPFRWTTGDSSMSIKVLDGGQYRIYTRTDSGCYFSDSVILDPTPIPTISISDKDSICFNDSIIAHIRPGGIYQNIIWNTGSLRTFTKPNFGTSYWVKVTATSQCEFTDTIVGIYQHPPIKTSFIADTTVSCDGDTVLLSALQSGVTGVNVNWNTGENTSDIKVVAQGFYSYLATDKYCSATDTTFLFHVTSPDASLPDSILVCPDYPSLLTAPANTSKTTYFWNGIKGNRQYSVDTQSVVYLEAVKAGVCVDRDTTFVIHAPQIAAGFTTGSDTLCLGDTLSLDPRIMISNYDVEWNTGDTVAEIGTLSGGQFICTVIADNGCVFRDSITVQAFTKPQNVNLGDDRVVCNYSNLVLSVSPVHNDKKFLWSDSSTNSTLTTTESGDYWVKVTNDKGCSTSDTMILLKKDPLPFIEVQNYNLCFGDTIVLDLTKADSVLWYLPDTVIDTNFLVLTYLNEGRIDYDVIDTEYGVKCILSRYININYEGQGEVFGKIVNNSLLPLKNHPVELVKIVDNQAVVIRKTTTNSSGDYSFKIGCPDSVVVRAATTDEVFKAYSPKGVDINRAKLGDIGPGDFEVRQVVAQERPGKGLGLVAGMVLDSSSQVPVDGLEVILVDAVSRNPVAIDTTSNGSFSFDSIPMGNYAVFVDRWGFVNQTEDRIPVSSITPDYDTLVFVYSDRYIRLLNILGVENNELNSTSVYPNPANDRVFIETATGSTTVKVYSMDGKPVYEGRSKAEKTELSVLGWSPGVYNIQLTDSNQRTHYVRLVVLH